MPCIIGMTTDLQRRKSEWLAKYSSLRNWRVYRTDLNRPDAQALEDRLAAQYGCQAHPG